MVNLLPQNLREQEEAEHKKALQQKQQESKVSYTRSAVQKQQPPKKKKGGMFSWLHKKDSPNSKPAKPKAPAVNVKNQPIKRTVQPIPVAANLPPAKQVAPKPQQPAQPNKPVKQKKDISQIFPFSLFIKKKRSAQKAQSQSSEPKKKAQKNKELQVNLISRDVLEERSHYKSERMLIIVAVSTIVVLAGLFVVTNYFKDRKIATIEQLKAQESIVDAALAQLNATNTEMRILQRRFNAAEELYSNHVYWTRLLGFFEEKTLSTIQYKNLSLNKDSPELYNLSGKASSVEDMLLQWNILEQAPEVLSVGLDSYTRGEQTTLVEEGVPELSIEDIIEEAAEQTEEEVVPPESIAVANVVDITFSLAVELDPSFLIGLYGDK